MNLVKAATVSKLDCVYITNLSTGAPITGATFTGVSISYFLSSGSAVTAASAVTATLGTWVTLGFKEVDATNIPGLYQVGVPNALFATAGTFGYLSVKGVTGQAPCVKEYQIVAYDPNAVATVDTPGVALNSDGSGNLNAAVVLGAVGSVAGNLAGSVAGTVSGVINPVSVDLTQAVPRSNTPETIGDGLHAMRAVSAGNRMINAAGPTLTYTESDGTTAALTFSLAPSAVAPTSAIAQ